MNNHDCFVMYDIKTLEIRSLSPCPIEPLDARHKVHKVQFKDIEPFLKAVDSSKKYILDVSQEYAKFVHNLWHLGNTRSIAFVEMMSNKVAPPNIESIVNDLNYRNYFFEHFCINVNQGTDFISFFLDLDNTRQAIKSRFDMSVTEENGLTELYITKFRDPTELYFTHKINIKK